MLFNSLDYAIFLPIVFIIYWGIVGKSLKLQNILLLIGSYLFYGWWDYRFLLLIAISTLVDFLIGLKLEKEESRKRRKTLLIASLFFNLGVLFLFKYFNFFIENWIAVWSSIGVQYNYSSLKLILPIGISFYTFQTLSYTIDIYQRKINATPNIIDFSTYVAFFPQLVAGPIERAQNLLPQFKKTRFFNLEGAKSGFHLILWGLFKKIVIADNCAVYADLIFGNYENYDSGMLVLGAVMFSFQIYGDFSGYSDIAIGSARLFGFKLMANFKYPYFSRNIGEFWRRWHISLSTWFRDYLYIPLGGSRGNKKQQIINVFIIFLVSGFWHGANWTFLFWGSLHSLFFLPLLWTKSNRKFLNVSASLSDFFRIIATFVIVSFAWIFFRSTNLNMAFNYIGRIFSAGFSKVDIPGYSLIEIIFLLVVFIWIEWVNRSQEHPLIGPNILLKVVLTILAIISFGYFKQSQEFIYFQF